MPHYYAALDVSLETTCICIVDTEGANLVERKTASDPDSIARVLAAAAADLARCGLEAGPLSPVAARRAGAPRHSHGLP